MRKAYSNVKFLEDDNTFYGISLGFDFCAELIELAEAVNSDYPGQNELAKKICQEIFRQVTLTCFIGLGCLVAHELSIRLRLALAFS